jgi:hypothetical protein
MARAYGRLDAPAIPGGSVKRTSCVTIGIWPVSTLDSAPEMRSKASISSIVTQSGSLAMVFPRWQAVLGFRHRGFHLTDMVAPAILDFAQVPAGQSQSQGVAWSRRAGGPYVTSPPALDEYLYVPQDKGSLTCYEARTGKVVYEQQPLGHALSSRPPRWPATAGSTCRAKAVRVTWLSRAQLSRSAPSTNSTTYSAPHRLYPAAGGANAAPP